MIKTLRNLLKQDKERFVVPRGVQDVIPIKAIYDDGIFQVEPEEMAGLFEALISMLEKMLGAEAGQLLARAQEYWKFEP